MRSLRTVKKGIWILERNAIAMTGSAFGLNSFLTIGQVSPLAREQTQWPHTQGTIMWSTNNWTGMGKIRNDALKPAREYEGRHSPDSTLGVSWALVSTASTSLLYLARRQSKAFSNLPIARLEKPTLCWSRSLSSSLSQVESWVRNDVVTSLCLSSVKNDNTWRLTEGRKTLCVKNPGRSVKCMRRLKLERTRPNERPHKR